MKKIVYVFPGQASQYVGMGRELYQYSDIVKQFYAQASELLGDDLAHTSFEGPADKLKQTKFTQPAILIHSLALLAIADGKLPVHTFAAGHSLGEYGALALSGALSYEDAITAVCTRAMLMEEACVINPGTMAAILALADDKLEEVVEAASKKGIVTAANINSALQVAVSGDFPAVEEACRLAKEAGAKRAVMLEVGGAFHSPLMASATDKMAACLDTLTINDAKPPVIANVTAAPSGGADDIKSLLVKQITSPVRWRDTMKFFMTEEIDTVVEIGPGKVLTGLAKRDMKGVELHNIDSLSDLESVLSTLS
ncbi:MAG: ACP S-malonyltransferase [candidate division Zixibacteria bacterium]|nr:ACP S-malonyltransferase [candidate division Zixibacteria bacterium]